jgi:hypothetical protein
VPLDHLDQAQPLLEKRAERQAVVVEVVEYAEFEHGVGTVGDAARVSRV